MCLNHAFHECVTPKLKTHRGDAYLPYSLSPKKILSIQESIFVSHPKQKKVQKLKLGSSLLEFVGIHCMLCEIITIPLQTELLNRLLLPRMHHFL